MNSFPKARSSRLFKRPCEGRSSFRVEAEQEADGRWIAEVIEISGALAYGATRDEAISRAA